jgi:hypothetical protein
MIIPTIDQDAANALFAHVTEADLYRAGSGHCPHHLADLTDREAPLACLRHPGDTMDQVAKNAVVNMVLEGHTLQRRRKGAAAP